MRVLFLLRFFKDEEGYSFDGCCDIKLPPKETRFEFISSELDDDDDDDSEMMGIGGATNSPFGLDDIIMVSKQKTTSLFITLTE